MELFTPNGNTVRLDATTSAHAAVSLSQIDGYQGGAVSVYNDGSVTVFVAFGTTSSVAAAIPTDGTPANGIPIASGGTRGFTVGVGTYVSTITASGTAPVYFTCGQGE
jgi:hypothetical protein